MRLFPLPLITALLCSVSFAAVAWPGGQRGFRGADDPGASLNATDVSWDFFKAQTK
jgi:hypothetical protein